MAKRTQPSSGGRTGAVSRGVPAPARPGSAVPREAIRPDARAGARSDRVPFLVAIGLSAFALFSLELWAGRVVLPVFGGTPAVWTTALCFFTAVLFLGYLYAHVLATRVAPARAGLIQAGVAIVAVVLTAIAPSSAADLRVAGLPEALNVLLVVAVIAGPAAFVLASTTPLLSSWFGARGEDPWWLYAVSNGASFAALLAYPFLVEPLAGLAFQRAGLVAALAAYGVAVGAIALRARASRAGAPVASGSAASSSGPAPVRRRQLLWLFAATVPAGLLSATTNYLQTDLVSAPFIWVGPLGIYLLSFVVVFSARGRRLLPAVDRLVPGAAALLWVPYVEPTGWPAAAILVIELLAFLVLAIAIHGRLALDRPGPEHLTRFYLVLSAGGMLGTAFVALVAPVAFPGIWEYPILLVAGLVALAALEGAAGRWLPSLREAPRGAALELARRLVPYAIVASVLFAFVAADPKSAPTIAGLFALAGVGTILGATPRLLALATPVLLVGGLLVVRADPALSKSLLETRDFFGVITVLESGNVHAEYSGTTLHGLQFTDDKATVPTSYYARSGPLGLVFKDLRARTNGASVGVVGLGAGTVTAYTGAGDSITYFEIDPAAIRIALNPAYFTYLDDPSVRLRIVEGDGRLSLAAGPASQFDVLVLDAFTSDAVPPHLLTREAISTYMRTLRPGGVLAFNVSNRYYNLHLAVAATARSLGLEAVGAEVDQTPATVAAEGAATSVWVVVGTPADVARLTALGWHAIPSGGPVLTDDYPDLLRVFRPFAG